MTNKPSSPASSTNFSPLSVDKRCSYPSKVCLNARAVKQNRTLHRLCEFHRRKANLNQQRMQQRRRIQLREWEDRESVSSSPAAPEYIDSMDDFGGRDSEFSLEELQLLESMLFDSSDELDSDLGQDQQQRFDNTRFSC